VSATHVASVLVPPRTLPVWWEHAIGSMGGAFNVPRER
jgi:hypothetical protein